MPVRPYDRPDIQKVPSRSCPLPIAQACEIPVPTCWHPHVACPPNTGCPPRPPAHGLVLTELARLVLLVLSRSRHRCSIYIESVLSRGLVSQLLHVGLSHGEEKCNTLVAVALHVGLSQWAASSTMWFSSSNRVVPCSSSLLGYRMRTS